MFSGGIDKQYRAVRCDVLICFKVDFIVIVVSKYFIDNLISKIFKFSMKNFLYFSLFRITVLTDNLIPFRHSEFYFFVYPGFH